MIGIPFNDRSCLAAITHLAADVVADRHAPLVELAARFPTTDALAEWIRMLPQRDDSGDTSDGPRVAACAPPQRLRVAPPDPNCFERAWLYLAVAELIDPQPVRQLATLDTPIGAHTFPIENGAPVVLDPRVTRNCLDGRLAIASRQAPIAVDARDAIDFAIDLGQAGAAFHRNGTDRARRGRNAIGYLVDRGAAPANQATIDAIAWLFAAAEGRARELGTRAIAIVKTVALAIAELADEAIARTHRQGLGQGRRMRYRALRRSADPIGLVSGLASLGDKAALAATRLALREQLGALGIAGDLLGLVEEELNVQGLSLGPEPTRLKMKLAAS